MISVVVPVLNESEVIPTLYGRLTGAADAWNEAFEVVVVDDGSSDDSAAQLDEIHRKDARWKVVTLTRSFGQQAAVSAGIEFARGDCVVVLDADLQDPPEAIGRLIEKWREGYHVVFAVRRRRKEGLLKRVCYRTFYRIMARLASISVPLDSGDFCLMDRRVVDLLRALPERVRYVRGLRAWAGFRQIGVEYERDPRFAGQPKYGMVKLLALALAGITSFSSAPLRAAGLLGVLLCASSILLIGLLVLWWFTDVTLFGDMHPRRAAGWTSLCALILFLSGVQMMLLGVLGEYVAVLFSEIKARPPWVVARTLGFGETEDPQQRTVQHSTAQATARR